MKNKILSFFAAGILTISASFSSAQTTAMNFNRNDCNGVNHNLFNELDAGNAVILEFFMNSCSSCITAGQTLENMKATLLAQYPGKIKSYAIGYTNSYNCTLINNWVNTNGFTSTPMDSGAMQVAYYGGFGMPTIVILGGGTAHSVLGNPYVGFADSDTTAMAQDIRNFLNSFVGVNEVAPFITDMKVFPSPATDFVTASLSINQATSVSINIIDLAGKICAKVLSNEKMQAGLVTKKINTAHLAEGSYFLQITENGKTVSRKFTIVR